MAGHSKWANIKHRKEIQDCKNSKIFTKIIREIVTAVKLGGSDPDFNPRLRAVISKALENKMTRDTISKAIIRAVNGDHDMNLEVFIYEGYGPGGTAVMIECLSNNRHRTVSEVRHAFTKCGGKLGAHGSVSYLFSKKAIITYSPGVNKCELIEAALASGAEDIVSHDEGVINVLISQENMSALKNALSSAGFKDKSIKIVMTPLMQSHIDSDTILKLLRLINMLEGCDDVHRVYHNACIPLYN